MYALVDIYNIFILFFQVLSPPPPRYSYKYKVTRMFQR